MSNILETCWHGQISKEEAENRLNGAGKANAYLFRRVTSREGGFSSPTFQTKIVDCLSMYSFQIPQQGEVLLQCQ